MRSEINEIAGGGVGLVKIRNLPRDRKYAEASTIIIIIITCGGARVRRVAARRVVGFRGRLLAGDVKGGAFQPHFHAVAREEERGQRREVQRPPVEVLSSHPRHINDGGVM